MIVVNQAQAAAQPAPPKAVNPNAPTPETVLSVKHWSDRLFSFRLTRPAAFRFKSGEFIMLGLEGEKKPILRAYSMASPAWDEELEFYSIKVPDGPLTSRLQKIQPGDTVLLGKKPTGTLVLDALTPGKRLSVKHWSDRLFSFRLTRPAAFRFKSGEFIMLGLEGEKKPILRAYSMASPAWDEELEFYSIKVPDGPLTSRLQKIQPGDTVLLGKKPTGTLVLDALTPGKRLYMFSTGTGIAPFASLIRDPETYEKFDEVILTQTAFDRSGLRYGTELAGSLRDDPLIGEFVGDKFRYFTSTTRDEDNPRNIGRITHLIENGKLFEELGVPRLNPETDRAMICGSMAMLNDTKALCEAAGLKEGANSMPGEFVVERAFVG